MLPVDREKGMLGFRPGGASARIRPALGTYRLCNLLQSQESVSIPKIDMKGERHPDHEGSIGWRN